MISIVALVIFAVVLLVGVTAGSALLVTVLEQGLVDVADADQRGVVAGTAVAVAVVLLICLSIAAMLEVWFFLVVLHCYRFFQDKETFGNFLNKRTARLG